MLPDFEAPKFTLIYIFRINDEAHADCLKIGETSFPDDGSDPLKLAPNSKILNIYARRRIDQYTTTAGIRYELLYTECSLYHSKNGLCQASDKDVHRVLERSDIKRKKFPQETRSGREWYEVDLNTAIQAIKAVKEGRESLRPGEITTGRSPVAFRPEQQDAIEKTIKRFERGTQMLWNAKMRFGKTLSALEVVRRLNIDRTLILTHRPVVNSGWFEDFGKIFYDRSDYLFGSKIKGETFENLEKIHLQKNIHYVYFASMQDLRGSEMIGGKFDKNDEIFSTHWDLLIVDEAHEGTQTDLGQAVLNELIKDKKTKVLQLSGTPFNLMDNFDADDIYTWDYVMEQQAKADWEETHFGDHNPYADLPRLNIYTYELGKVFRAYADEDIAFNFREFFRIDEKGSFVHEDDVSAFLNLLSREDENSKYPFSCDEFRKIFRHTLWVLPGVKAAKALSKLLKTHPVFQHFQVVNVAGDGDEEEENHNALDMVEEAIGNNPAETRTITLSCGRLTTGVTVKAWTGVFMLAGSYNTSASSYMQTIFRVQTPASINGRMKEECYVFDFAPDRTLQVLATVPRVSRKAGTTSDSQKEELGRFLNFCPVIAVSGSRMETLNVSQMLQQLKKAYVERVVRSGFEDNCLYNDNLYTLNELELKEFENLRSIIGSTKAIKTPGNVDINNQGLTKEEYEESELLTKKKKKDRTDEEQARLEELRKKKKERLNAISILRSISIRMPLLIYGAELEKEGDEITIDNFASLIDSQSWEEFMPKDVTKEYFDTFKKYYDPEIFTAAGKRIRSLTRAADKLSIENRIARITAIFSTFRNPDKETVLTPWRVVNLHMGETLGGYNFFDSKYESELETPRFIDKGSTTKEVFATDSKLLEINSKSGLYPLYLTYNIYRAKLNDYPSPPATLEGQQAIWANVVAKNIYIICKTPMAKAITRRTLLGFSEGRINAHYFENLIDQIRNKPSAFIERVTRGRSFWKAIPDNHMKFNAVVGNPPYQEIVAKAESKNGQKPSKSIFHYFQIVSEKLGRYTSLIYPGARWIHRSGKGLDTFGLQQINDPHLSLLEFFPESTEIFKDVAIADGLSIVLKDMQKTSSGFEYVFCKDGKRVKLSVPNPGTELLPLNPNNITISSQLEAAISKFACLHDSILPRSLFSIESDFVEKNPSLVTEYVSGTPFDPSHQIKIFTNDKSGKSGRAKWYVAERGVVTTGLQYLDKWKVIVSSANAGGQKRSNQIEIVDNHSAFGRVRVALKAFNTEKEAHNFLLYATSEIIRFAFLLTDESLTSLAKKVPDLQDYSDQNGLVDYSGDVDKQLYELFGIADKDQEYIKAYLKTRREKN